MYGALDAYMGEFKPGLVELDVLADQFSGDENNRPQVTQFVGLLRDFAANIIVRFSCSRSQVSSA
jgi:hypothetical protein